MTEVEITVDKYGMFTCLSFFMVFKEFWDISIHKVLHPLTFYPPLNEVGGYTNGFRPSVHLA